MFKIEKGIKMPESRQGVKKYPWKEMEIGDSFFVEGAKYNELRSPASYAGSRYNLKFTVRQVTDGVRVWRVK